MRKLFLFTTVSLFFCLKSIAQLWNAEAGFGIGASIYQGDLSPYWFGAYNRPGLNFQFTGQVPIFPGFSIRGSYAFSSISDNEENYTSGVHRVRKLNFSTTINELSAHLIVNPSFNSGEENIGTVHPYFFGGVGIGFLSVKRDWSKFGYSFPYWQTWVLPGLKTDSLMQLPKSSILFPVGLGVRYQIGYNLSLYGEVNKRIAKTEYLDGFSKVANPKENDGFASFSVGLTFKLSGDGGGYGGGGYSGGGGGGIFSRIFGGGSRDRRNRGRVDCPTNVY